MDLLEVKSRIAEALVESIFRRARYQIKPFRNNTSPLRFGREDFSPDFRVTSDAEGDNGGGEFLVEVKELRIFQHNIEDHEELIRRIFSLLTGAQP
jgi:hypothetical protein